MAVFAKATTYGLESKVKELQEYLDAKLFGGNIWSGDSEIYGVMNPLRKDLETGTITVPEAYKGTGANNKEYSEVFINDKVAVTIGFLVLDRSLLPYRSANIDIVFTILLPKIYPTSTTRDREKALLEAEKALENYGGIQSVLDVKEGVEDVFSDFDTERIKYRDMHPWYVFSLNIDLTYSDDSCQ